MQILEGETEEFLNNDNSYKNKDNKKQKYNGETKVITPKNIYSRPKQIIPSGHISSEMYSPTSSDHERLRATNINNVDKNQEHNDKNESEFIHKQLQMMDRFSHQNTIAQKHNMVKPYKTISQNGTIEQMSTAAISKLALNNISVRSKRNEAQGKIQTMKSVLMKNQTQASMMKRASNKSCRSVSQTGTSLRVRSTNATIKRNHQNLNSKRLRNETISNTETNIFNQVLNTEEDTQITSVKKDNNSLKRRKFMRKSIKTPQLNKAKGDDTHHASILFKSYHPDTIYTVKPHRISQGSRNLNLLDQINTQEIDQQKEDTEGTEAQYSNQDYLSQTIPKLSYNTRQASAYKQSRFNSNKASWQIQLASNNYLNQTMNNRSELKTLLGIQDLSNTQSNLSDCSQIKRQAKATPVISTHMGNFIVQMSPKRDSIGSIFKMNNQLDDSTEKLDFTNSSRPSTVNEIIEPQKYYGKTLNFNKYFKKKLMIEKPSEQKMMNKNPNRERDQKDFMIQKIYRPGSLGSFNRNDLHANPKRITQHTNQMVRHDQNMELLSSLGIPQKLMIKDHLIKDNNSQEKFNSTSKTKSQSQFVRREREFKKAFNDKVSQWRKDSGPVVIPDYMQGKKNQTLNVDISLYKERDDNYKIIGNRILARSKEPDRKYVNKNVKIIQETFDPLRIRLRVMPMWRCPAVRSKNSDFYFIEAQKLSLRGDLPNAMKMLKKGLEIKPEHLLCRFNHGVLMFKFGLITEAISDFRFLTENYKKESWAFLNLAICLVQIGKPHEEQGKYVSSEYSEAIKNCIHAIQVSDSIDKQLRIDAYNLRAMCHYRLHEPLLAVKYFMIAKRIKQTEKDFNINKNKQNDESATLNLEQNLTDLVIKEYAAHFTEAEHMNLCMKRSNSFDFKRHVTLPQQYPDRKLSDCGSIRNHQTQIDDQNVQYGVRTGGVKLIEVVAADASESKPITYEETSQVESCTSQYSREQKVQEALGDHIEQDLVQKPHRNKTQESRMSSNNLLLRDQILREVEEQESAILKKGNVLRKPKRSAKSMDGLTKLIASNIKRSFQQKMVEDIKKLKVQLLTKDGILKNRNTISQSEQWFRQFYKEMVKKQIKEVDKDEPRLRCRQMYLQQQKNYKWYDIDEDNQSLNSYELAEIEKRKQNEIWVNQNQELKDVLNEAIKSGIYKDKNASFIELMLNVSDIKMRNALPSESENGLDFIQQKHAQLEKMMKQLSQSFAELQRIWDRDLHINDLIINSQNVIKPKEKYGVKNLEREDQLIDKLKDALTSSHMTPDDVCNFLSNDLDEKEKLKQQIQFKLSSTKRRLPFQYMRFVERQFKLKPERRDLQQLDMVLHNLKYLRLYQENQRHQIYLWAKYVSYPTQHVLFKQGDIGRHFYIILKGRVGIVKWSEKLGDTVINILQDGDQFGELSLINITELNNKMNDQKKKGGGGGDGPVAAVAASSSQSPTKKQQVEVQEYMRRRATIITYENTELLEIAHEYANVIYQPDHTKEKQNDKQLKDFVQQCTKRKSLKPKPVKMSTQGEIILETKKEEEIDNDGMEAFQDRKDPQKIEERNREVEMTKKIAFLKSIKLFSDISNKDLMPLALNMKEKVFKYGEFLQKANQVPKGLYIIKSGQCKVCGTRIASRDKTDFLRQQAVQSKTIQDKNPLFLNYDPDNTLLNEVKTRSKQYQNSRVYVTEKGEQVKGEIMYHDHQVFSQLMPKNYFGGRTIVPFELYMQLRKVYFGIEYIERSRTAPNEEEEPEEKYQMKSFLNVIADSHEVRVYIINKQTIGFLSDHSVKSVFDSIIQEKEPDRPNTEDKVNKKINNWIDWQNEKVKLTQKILVEMYREKNKTILAI